MRRFRSFRARSAMWWSCLALGCSAAVWHCGPEQPPYMDAVTSASPQALGIKVSQGSHLGWGKWNCSECHGEVHYSGYSLGDCAHCHGTNGAPHRSAPHGTGDCQGCHATQLHRAGLKTTGDCVACHQFRPEDGCGATSDHEVVIVGAGGGGLAAAAALAREGRDVVVLEQHFKVGGYMTNFRRGPYSFESSLHGFDGLDPVSGMNVQLFEDLDIRDRVTLVRPDPIYRVLRPQGPLDIPSDVQEYRALLQQEYPEEAKNIEALFTRMIDLFELLTMAQSLDIDTPPSELSEEVKAKLAELTGLLQLGDITTAELVGEYVQNPELIDLFTILGGFGGNGPETLPALMFVALWGSYHVGGYYYFEGSSQAVSDALAAVIRENGGQILLNSRVSKLVVEGEKVTQVQTADGRCYNADYVISNASAPQTFFELIGEEHLPGEYLEKLQSMTLSTSMFMVFLGLDTDLAQEMEDVHEVMGIPPLSGQQSLTFNDGCSADTVSLGISNYSLVDPLAAPAGKTSLVVATVTKHDCFDSWLWSESHEAYRQNKDAFAEILLQRLEAELPGLGEHIEITEVATPRTLEAYTLNPQGAIMGWDNTIGQSLFKRLPMQTPIENLLLAGSWTFPGGGQSAVLQSGVFAAEAILQPQ